MKISREPLRLNVIFLILVLGLVAFILYFYFFINPARVADILSKTNLAYYTGAFVAYFMYAFFSALVWRQLLNSLSVKISSRKALLFTWVGLFFEATVPQLGWSGEVSKTYLLIKDSSGDAGKIGASVVGQKIFTITMTDVALGLGLGLVLVSYPLPFIVTFLIAFVLALSILSLLLVYYVSLKPKATKTLLNWGIRIASFFRKRWTPQNFRLKAEELLGTFHLGMEQLNANRRALAKPIIYAVISFIFEVSDIFLVFVALGYPVPVDKVLIVFTLTGTLQTVGVTFFGFPELIMSVSFTALGIPAALSVSVTLLTRVVSLWFRLIVSYGALQWAGSVKSSF
ncbi:MAG: lysylphosphatidylglycerol synthase transmembrane domain-containing protein [Candidatus Bathyarchaeia archaeon]